MAKRNSDDQDELILRISECETVIHDLETTPTWKIIQRDLKASQKEIDDAWQVIWDEKKLLAARVLKFAYQYVLKIKDEYKEELKDKKRLLGQLQNPKKEVIKDWDTE